MERASRGKSAAAAAVMLLLFGGVSSKVCQGSSNQLNQLGNHQNHYENLRQTFENCTSVLKNLEITHTQAQHNLSFLQSIEEVGGYVLIAMNEAVTVPLSQLRLIRGQSLYDGKFSLLVMANFNYIPKSRDYRSGMRELLLSNLTEIMNGGVKITNNPFLCHINSIQWWDILDQNSKSHMVLRPEDHPKNCPRCDLSCVNGSCWAPGPQHCQKFTRLLCADQCSHRCRGPSPGDCCHEHCAAGCTGPLASQCLACRLFDDEGTCQRSCPRPVIYDVNTRELVPNPQAKFTYGPTCVKACPDNYLVTDWACVRSCPPGKHEVLEDGVYRCKDSNSLSPKACDGIGMRALVNTLAVNSTNIESFRNCTKIIGDIIFFPSSFNGDHHYNVPPLDPSKLEVFRTLREITGFLLIQFWPENFTSLSVFENLQIIRGRTLHRGYSLVVMQAQGLRWLGLRSLREISHGKVMLKNNSGLCYTGPDEWGVLFKSEAQSITYMSNGEPKSCRALNSSCDPLCSGEGCWGPGPTLCVSCLYLNRGGRCVQSCYVLQGEPREVELDGYCVQCHSECKVQEGASTCSGPGPDQCSFCAHAQDGFVCVGQCPQGLLGTQLWKYEDEEHQCQSCHMNCTKGCNGPSMSDCIGESRSPVMAAVIVGSLLAIVLVALVVFVLLRRRRITRKRTLRRILQERELVEPLTPSGQAPNQALLRILKETEIRKVRVLGSGAFGTVYKGFWFPEGEQAKIRVAIKVLREATSPKANQEILDEAYVMASVDHPHVSRLLGVCLTSAVQLVTQLMPYGALLDYVRHHQHLVGAQRILNWCVQIAKGMSYLEDRHLVHRDLAARNVLVKSPNHVKITDFGLAKLLTANESEYHADGGKVPIKWMALESILQSTYTHQSDVWSYGVTVWELMTFGSRPYDGISAPEICSVLERGERLPQPPICTIDVYMIMVKCWMINPSSRPRFWELVRDFSEMARDPQHFLVIQGELPSPSDSRFFSRLISTDDDVDAEEYLMPYREGGAGLGRGRGRGSITTATNGAVRRGNNMALRYITDPTLREEEEEEHEYMNQTVDQADAGACGSDVLNPNYEDLTLKWTGSGVASALEEPGPAEYLNAPQKLPAMSAELPEYMNPDSDQGGPDYVNPDYVNSGYRSSSTGADCGRPLDGIRVLDLTRVLAGPFATMLLGDLGAEVIKVEKPGSGDDTRAWGPPFMGTESVYFLSVNRNKKSIAVDMKHPDGAKVLRELAAVSDVLVENFLPGKLSEFGLGPEQLRAENPELIYCSITGYGQSGPSSRRPGYDSILSAESGMMHITGPEGGEPVRPGVAMTDLATGLYAHGSIMAALLQRQRSGAGAHIDCNLLSSQVSCLSHIAANFLNSGQEGKRWGTAHESIVPYQGFKTSDGHIVVAVGNDTQFMRVCEVLGLPALAEDPNYKTNKLRVQNRSQLLPLLSLRLAEESTCDWLRRFEGSGVPVGPINNLQQVFSDAQVKHNGLLQHIEHPTSGALCVPGPAVRFSSFLPLGPAPPPLIGQHTISILTGSLDYSEQEVTSLLQSGAVAQYPDV